MKRSRRASPILLPLKALSLGWGIQSWCIAAMAALGVIEKPDYAVHADTTWERAATYQFAQKWTPWLEAHGVKVVTVSDPDQARKVETDKTDIPAFTFNGRTDGQLKRQCTGRWKIQPIRRFVQSVRDGRAVEQWLGISLDEMGRAGPSGVKYITHRYPLLELRLTRGECVLWLEKQNLPIPPKSSCVFCPYHNQVGWKDTKRNPEDWETAVMVDEAIRKTRPPYDLYVHPSRKPLREVVQLEEDFGYTQLSLIEMGCGSGYCFL